MEKEDRKSARKKAKQAIKNYLEDNDCEALKPSGNSCCGSGLQEFDAQTHDAWILTCPKSLDSSLLEGKRIKLPGRRYVGHLKVRGSECATASPETIAYTNVKGKNKVRNIPISGIVVVSKRLNLAKPSATQAATPFPATPPPPNFMLPLRHPFFGRDFKRHIELPKEISKKLMKANKKRIATAEFVRRNANFYRVRKQILGSTQTLEEKEYEVRQSVLTGVRPDFMNESAPKYDLGDLTSDDKEERIKKKQVSSVKKPKKRKANKEVAAIPDSADGASRKKRKKLVTE
ncbi:uncharacterized protein LOC117581205 [Drosophila guanche]|uniref:Uncharacterized protein n=1 Tax=Drosophila guanche TaxID=7266 RepID=A0A3B0J6Y9_DROGU|nr:uncharacterized protein LOC117581205 [Drosophila guanche]SPP77817.1 Hypothetical predicted protein [Drosophila guanche]